MSDKPVARTPKEKLREAVERNERRTADWPEHMRDGALAAPVFVGLSYLDIIEDDDDLDDTGKWRAFAFAWGVERRRCSDLREDLDKAMRRLRAEGSKEATEEADEEHGEDVMEATKRLLPFLDGSGYGIDSIGGKERAYQTCIDGRYDATAEGVAEAAAKAALAMLEAARAEGRRAATEEYDEDVTEATRVLLPLLGGSGYGIETSCGKDRAYQTADNGDRYDTAAEHVADAAAEGAQSMIESARAEGRRAERDDTIAWLRTGIVSESCDDDYDRADAIERGEHQRSDDATD